MAVSVILGTSYYEGVVPWKKGVCNFPEKGGVVSWKKGAWSPSRAGRGSIPL